MTEKIFWQDPYQTKLETHITSVQDGLVTVAETIFYAFAGGQERDFGTIGGQEVRDAEKDGLEIFYTLDREHGFGVGDAVRMEIDWARRYKLMRLHFAVELVLELVYQMKPGIEKIGAHISEDKSRVDFLWGESFTPILPTIHERAMELINADHQIISAFSDAANERRYWEIEGFARVSCGGTHLRRTGEIGSIRLRRKNVGKGKERIEVYLEDGRV